MFGQIVAITKILLELIKLIKSLAGVTTKAIANKKAEDLNQAFREIKAAKTTEEKKSAIKSLADRLGGL